MRLDIPNYAAFFPPSQLTAIVLHTLKGTGLTIILAEQHVPMALDLADRALILSLGHIALSGTPAELRDSEDIKRIYLGG